MQSRRFTLLLLAATAAALVAALPVAGKEGVEATLTTRVPLHAPAGTRLQVAWTLGYLDAKHQWHPFGGGGIFIRLVSASGRCANTALAHGKPGRYAATVRVPKGGIGKLEIGIHSWADGPAGRRAADWLFPITNNPVPKAARVARSSPQRCR